MNTAEQLASDRQAARAAARAKIPAARTAAQRMGIPLEPGARVLDTLTGKEGTVYAVRVANDLRPGS